MCHLTANVSEADDLMISVVVQTGRSISDIRCLCQMGSFVTVIIDFLAEPSPSSVRNCQMQMILTILL